MKTNKNNIIFIIIASVCCFFVLFFLFIQKSNNNNNSQKARIKNNNTNTTTKNNNNGSSIVNSIWHCKKSEADLTTFCQSGGDGGATADSSACNCTCSANFQKSGTDGSCCDVSTLGFCQKGGDKGATFDQNCNCVCSNANIKASDGSCVCKNSASVCQNLYGATFDASKCKCNCPITTLTGDCCAKGTFFQKSKNGKSGCCPVSTNVLGNDGVCCDPSSMKADGTCCPNGKVARKDKNGKSGCCGDSLIPQVLGTNGTCCSAEGLKDDGTCCSGVDRAVFNGNGLNGCCGFQQAKDDGTCCPPGQFAVGDSTGYRTSCCNQPSEAFVESTCCDNSTVLVNNGGICCGLQFDGVTNKQIQPDQNSVNDCCPPGYWDQAGNSICCPIGQMYQNGKCQCDVNKCKNGHNNAQCNCTCDSPELIFNHATGNCECPTSDSIGWFTKEYVNGKCQCLPSDKTACENTNGSFDDNECFCNCPGGLTNIGNACGCPGGQATNYDKDVCCPVGFEIINGECDCDQNKCGSNAYADPHNNCKCTTCPSGTQPILGHNGWWMCQDITCPPNNPGCKCQNPPPCVHGQVDASCNCKCPFPPYTAANYDVLTGNVTCSLAPTGPPPKSACPADSVYCAAINKCCPLSTPQYPNKSNPAAALAQCCPA